MFSAGIPSIRYFYWNCPMKKIPNKCWDLKWNGLWTSTKKYAWSIFKTFHLTEFNNYVILDAKLFFVDFNIPKLSFVYFDIPAMLINIFNICVCKSKWSSTFIYEVMSCYIQEHIAIQVVDGVLEDIRLGMEVRRFLVFGMILLRNIISKGITYM